MVKFSHFKIFPRIVFSTVNNGSLVGLKFWQINKEISLVEESLVNLYRITNIKNSTICHILIPPIVYGIYSVSTSFEF